MAFTLQIDLNCVHRLSARSAPFPPICHKMNDLKHLEALYHVIPNQTRKLRACLLCSLVKSLEHFEMDGCENCDDFLHLRSNVEAIFECTSSNFSGIFALLKPEDSWVGRWQRVDKCIPGVYAISVAGKLPSDIVSELQSHGIVYKSRDTSNI